VEGIPNERNQSIMETVSGTLSEYKVSGVANTKYKTTKS